MMIRLAGLPFRVEPPRGLSAAERQALSRLPPGEGPGDAPTATAAPPFVLELVEGPVASAPGAGERGEGLPDEAPAAVDWDGASVTIRHRRLAADLDPAARHGRLRRDGSVGWPLEVTLRTALAARLPLEGGLPLHAAGVVVNGKGVAFFGPSGAGKSTLAASCPQVVLSDEMVAVVPGAGGGYRLGGTGFWGTFESGDPRADLVPLAALVELDKGRPTRLDRLDARSALRRLVASTLVPPAPPLWSAALAVIGALVRVVPAFRLAWSPSEPWEAIEEALGRGLTPRD